MTHPQNQRPYGEQYAALPPLPIPTLEETLARYRESIRPLVDDATFETLAADLAAFGAPGGLGERLQAALEAKAAGSDNWLAEWWDDVAYLAFPEPLLINSNFGISCDARQPVDDPAERAAEVAVRTIDLALALQSGAWPAETAGKAQTPLDMSLFPKILGAVRTPGRERDAVVAYGADATHIVVGRRNRFYKIEVVRDGGRAATVADLADEFRRIIADVDADQSQEPPLAVLTTERRPLWALERARLMGDATNAASLQAIESALFAVYLDEDRYDDFNATARAAIHGRPGQRWMDKVFAYVVDAAGRVSQHGEHSPADGMQFVTIFDHGCDKAARGVERAKPKEQARTPGRAAPAKLDWTLSADTRVAIQAATTHFEGKTQDLDIEVLHFSTFGKDVVKTLKVGPDSFVQLAYQLAYRRLHGATPKTYESAQTRMYRLGRTETIRTASTESARFTQLMDAADASDAERIAAFRAAAEVHGRRAKEAAAGFGVDRHLLGLQLVAAEVGAGPLPDVFSSEVHTRGWELSTAQLPMKALLVNGFGPVTPTGYGIGYVIQAGDVTCHITSFRSAEATSSKMFADTLAQAFRDLRTLLASEH